ncbi:14289_t:CDS:2 [Cetraspora pellucida]|uniref:14289_t:CDS:1 n=1 Tax=Cetraspora pellucida TaxID=1433469 RepID=A0ACA9LTC6_9GLOM|nr:14289_t:CDS:2 [Cetraspora pellucida]
MASTQQVASQVRPVHEAVPNQPNIYDENYDSETQLESDNILEPKNTLENILEPETPFDMTFENFCYLQIATA